MPDITVINQPKDPAKKDEIELQDSKLIVFTAFLLETKIEVSDSINEKHIDSWYPTIYFFKLSDQRSIWEIHGGE